MAVPPTLREAGVGDRGYRTLTGLPADVLAALTDLYEDLGIDPSEASFVSSRHASRDVARHVDKELKALLTPCLAPLVGEVEPFMAAFISKGPRASPLVHLHQDWTYTDERTTRATLAWVPLVDTNLANGAMSVVPGSHLWSTGIRSDRTDAPTDEIQDRLAAAATFVPLRRGEALLYDPGLIHGTSPNRSADPRPVAAIAFAPRGAPLTHFHMEPSGDLSGYQVDESYYTTASFRAAPVGAPRVDAWAPPVSAEDILAGLDRASGPPTATDGSAGGTATDATSSNRSIRSSYPSEPELVDRRLNGQLHRYGFARFRLLDPDAASDLREGFGLLHGWAPTEADADPSISSPYRRAAAEMIGAVLSGPLSVVFTGGESFLQRFDVAWPGGHTGEPHQDWTFVDERRGATTITVWLALEDVDGENGQLRILRGSQDLPRALRGPGLEAPWLRHRRVIEDRLVSVPLRAGECLALDPRLVRATFANSTSEPRVAVVFSVRPVGEPLVHVRRDPTGGARIAVVDSGFFDACRPGSPDALPRVPTDGPDGWWDAVEVVPFDPASPGEAELARTLDRVAGGPLQAIRRRVARTRTASRRRRTT